MQSVNNQLPVITQKHTRAIKNNGSEAISLKQIPQTESKTT